MGGLGPIPAIDSLDSPGLGLRQTLLRVDRPGRHKHGTTIAGDLRAVPSNVGPRTTPNYEAELAAEGMHSLPGGIRVFAGQRDDPFAIDLGGVFDSLNLRRSALAPQGTWTCCHGFNVDSSIGLEVPTSMVSGRLDR